MKTQIGIMSSVFILSLSAWTSSASSINRDMDDACYRDGMCHYGGRCDDDGLCRCMFDCNPTSWPTTLYCGPKTGGRRKIYHNLCLLLAHACEIQSDIPVIKYNAKTQKCEDEIPPLDKLCETPQDFMGLCGGTLAVDGNLGSGVCLLDTKYNQKRCHCPADRVGTGCQIKAILSELNSENTRNNQTVAADYTEAKIAMYISVVFLIAVVVGYFLFRWFKVKFSNRNSCCFDQENHASSCGKLDVKETAMKKKELDSRSSHIVTASSEKLLKENENQKLLPVTRRERLSARSFEFSSDPKSRDGEDKKEFLSENNLHKEHNLDHENNNNRTENEKLDRKTECNIKDV